MSITFDNYLEGGINANAQLQLQTGRLLFADCVPFLFNKTSILRMKNYRA